MRILMASGLALLLAVAGLIAFVIIQQLQNPTLSARDTPSGERGMLSGFLHSITSDAATGPSMPIDTFLPPGTATLQRLSFDIAHAQTVTGETYRESRLSQTTTQDEMGHYQRYATGSRNRASATYAAPGGLILARVNYLPDKIIDEENNGMMSGMISKVSPDDPPFDTGAGAYHSVGMLHFRKDRQSSHDWRTDIYTPVDYQSFTARLGQQVTIKVMTNAPDDEIIAFLDTFDSDALIEQLVAEDAQTVVAAHQTRTSANAVDATGGAAGASDGRSWGARFAGFFVKGRMPMPQAQSDEYATPTLSDVATNPMPTQTDIPAVAPPTETPVAKPSVRRGVPAQGLGGGGVCTIQKGARRCVVSN